MQALNRLSKKEVGKLIGIPVHKGINTWERMAARLRYDIELGYRPYAQALEYDKIICINAPSMPWPVCQRKGEPKFFPGETYYGRPAYFPTK